MREESEVQGSLFGIEAELDRAGLVGDRKRKLSRSSRVVLTERDFEILRFILEMKFASSAEVFQKFFKKTRSSDEARSDAWAKKRLLQLQRANFLRATYAYSESTRYFIATLKTYQTLKSLNLERFVCKPTIGFDNRTFIHDKLLLKLRLASESSLKEDAKWISDRMLRSGLDTQFGFNAKFVPDAIIESSEHGLVAIEVEIATKSKIRYREKVRDYVKLLRSSSHDRALKKVRYVCFRNHPFEVLRQETKIFGDYFSVELMDPRKFLNEVVA